MVVASVVEEAFDPFAGAEELAVTFGSALPVMFALDVSLLVESVVALVAGNKYVQLPLTLLSVSLLEIFLRAGISRITFSTILIYDWTMVLFDLASSSRSLE